LAPEASGAIENDNDSRDAFQREGD